MPFAPDCPMLWGLIVDGRNEVPDRNAAVAFDSNTLYLLGKNRYSVSVVGQPENVDKCVSG
jgi:hypothetical protein